MRNAGLEETQAGIKIARRNINNLRYAGDTTLMAETQALPVSLTQAPSGSTSPVNQGVNSLVNQGERHNPQLNDSQMAPAFHELFGSQSLPGTRLGVLSPGNEEMCLYSAKAVMAHTGSSSSPLCEQSTALQHSAMCHKQSGL